MCSDHNTCSRAVHNTISLCFRFDSRCRLPLFMRVTISALLSRCKNEFFFALVVSGYQRDLACRVVFVVQMWYDSINHNIMPIDIGSGFETTGSGRRDIVGFWMCFVFGLMFSDDLAKWFVDLTEFGVALIVLARQLAPTRYTIYAVWLEQYFWYPIFFIKII